MTQAIHAHYATSVEVVPMVQQASERLYVHVTAKFHSPVNNLLRQSLHPQALTQHPLAGPCHRQCLSRACSHRLLLL